MEWRASHILVKDKRLADELLRKIKQGAGFESLAREHSTCPSKSRGGRPGLVRSRENGACLRECVQEALFRLRERRCLHFLRISHNQAYGKERIAAHGRGACDGGAVFKSWRYQLPRRLRSPFDSVPPLPIGRASNLLLREQKQGGTCTHRRMSRHAGYVDLRYLPPSHALGKIGSCQNVLSIMSLPPS